MLHSIYAIPEPAPGPNTMQTLCSSGKCITPNTYPTPNATKGAFPVGNYPHGIKLSDTKLIGIQLSDSCLKLIRNHFPTSCPTYDKLKIFDNTDPIFDGQWVNDTWYHRLNPRSDQYTFFTTHFVVMVDPNTAFTTHARMIIVQPGNFTYINPDDIITNHTRVEYHDRFVTSCESANVGPSLWLINDTIQYFENDCTHTDFNDRSKSQMIETPFSYNNPYSTLHYSNLIHQLKIDNVGDCIHFKCKYKDAYSNPDW